MKNQLSISIIFPVYNEEKDIKVLLEQTVVYLDNAHDIGDYVLVVVDDGSTDNSSSVLDELSKVYQRIKIVTHQKNMGYGAAMMSGIKNSDLPWVLLMDADGQIKIESLSAAVAFTEEYDIITGYRQKRMDPFYRIILGKTYTCIVEALFRVKLRDINCGFKLFKRKYLDIMNVNSHAGAFYTQLFIYAKQKNANIKEVPIEHYKRMHGRQTGASLRVIYEAIMDVLRLKFEKKDKK